VLVLPGVAGGVRFPHRDHARGRGDDDRHPRLPEFRDGDIPRVRAELPDAGGAGDPDPAGLGHPGPARRMARLRHRRRVRPRCDRDPAGRGLAADAGDPDVPAVRGRHHRLAHPRPARGRGRRQQHRLMQPAGFWQRCAAWTLDAAVLVPASLLLAWPWLRPAVAGWKQAGGAILGLMGERVAAAAMAGTPPLQLASAVLHDPALGAAAAALHAATWLALAPTLVAFALLGAAWNVAGER